MVFIFVCFLFFSLLLAFFRFLFFSSFVPSCFRLMTEWRIHQYKEKWLAIRVRDKWKESGEWVRIEERDFFVHLHRLSLFLPLSSRYTKCETILHFFSLYCCCWCFGFDWVSSWNVCVCASFLTAVTPNSNTSKQTDTSTQSRCHRHFDTTRE